MRIRLAYWLLRKLGSYLFGAEWSPISTVIIIPIRDSEPQKAEVFH